MSGVAPMQANATPSTHSTHRDDADAGVVTPSSSLAAALASPLEPDDAAAADSQLTWRTHGNGKRQADHAAHLPLVDAANAASDAEAQLDFTSPSSSASATSAISADDAAAARSAWLLRVAAWVALLIAVFSMAAVGPMFLYLEKKSVAPLRAVFWRQTTQTLCLIIPTWMEHQWTPVAARAWWNKRVELASDKKKEVKAAKVAAAAAAAAAEGLALSPMDSDRMLASPTAASSSSSPSGASASSPSGGASAYPTRIDVAVAVASPTEGDDEDVALAPAEQQPASSQLKGRSALSALMWVAFFWWVSVSLWVIALPYTSAARASLFSSLYPLFIICWVRLYHKVPVSLGEFMGVLVCLLGIASSEFISSIDPDTNTIAASAAAAAERNEAAAHTVLNGTAGGNGTMIAAVTVAAAGSISLFSGLSVTQLQFLGDVLCIIGSLFIACNVVEASPTRRVVPLFAFTLVTSVMVWCCLLLSTLALEGTSLDTHPTMGAFGWLSSGEMALRIWLFGFVVGMIGVLGFNFSVAHIHPIVFSSVQLLDPGLSGIISALTGVENWPNVSTYIGVSIVTAGIFIVVWYQGKRENAAEAVEKAAKAAAAGAAASSGADGVSVAGAATGSGASSPQGSTPSNSSGSSSAIPRRRRKAYQRVGVEEEDLDQIEMEQAVAAATSGHARPTTAAPAPTAAVDEEEESARMDL